jgi:hypothetical protein
MDNGCIDLFCFAGFNPPGIQRQAQPGPVVGVVVARGLEISPVAVDLPPKN